LISVSDLTGVSAVFKLLPVIFVNVSSLNHVLFFAGQALNLPVAVAWSA
jgi:hypothetical protein